MTLEEDKVIESARRAGLIYTRTSDNTIVTTVKFDSQMGCKYDGPIPIEKFIELYYKWLLRGKS